MKLSEYVPGDRIIAVGKVDDLDLTDAVGTVLFSNNHTVGIQFDEPFEGGHDCGERGKYGYCRYCYIASEIRLYYEEEIADLDESEDLNLFISGFRRDIC